MELKLNVYNGNKIEKTYITDDFRLMTGTCEDILNIIEIDKLTKIDLDNMDGDSEILASLTGMIMGLFKQFNPIIKQIFPDMTDDEYRRTDMGEVASLVWQVIQYTFGQLFNASSKN